MISVLCTCNKYLLSKKLLKTHINSILVTLLCKCRDMRLVEVNCANILY